MCIRDRCSSDLADTTADTVYYLTIFIGCRCLVAIFKSKRLKAFVTRDHLSRHKQDVYKRQPKEIAPSISFTISKNLRIPDGGILTILSDKGFLMV